MYLRSLDKRLCLLLVGLSMPFSCSDEVEQPPVSDAADIQTADSQIDTVTDDPTGEPDGTEDRPIDVVWDEPDREEPVDDETGQQDTEDLADAVDLFEESTDTEDAASDPTVDVTDVVDDIPAEAALDTSIADPDVSAEPDVHADPDATVVPLCWSDPIPISPAPSAGWGGRYVRLAADGLGNAFAIWREDDGSNSNIFAARYSGADGTWSTAAPIETGDAYRLQARIAANESGDAIAVWTETGGSDDMRLWYNTYSIDDGWETEADTTGALVSDSVVWAEIVLDAAGDGTATWERLNGTVRDAYVNHYDATTGWGTPFAINDRSMGPGSGNALTPQIARGAAGNLMVIFSQWAQTTNTDIVASHYTPAGGWAAPALVEPGVSATGSRHPAVAFDSNGDAIAVWGQFESAMYQVRANRFDATTGWSDSAEWIGPPSTYGHRPQIGFDATGNAIAVWVTGTGVSANRWNPAGDGTEAGWEGPVDIDNSDGGVENPSARKPVLLAVNPPGHAVAIWSQLFGGDSYVSVWTNRYLSGDGWQDAEVMDTGDFAAANGLSAVITSSNVAIVAWQQRDSADPRFRIYAATCDLP